jgi:hypothetical protein
VILDFVRRNLPARSPDAYPAEELAQLNLSRSQQRPFEPYPASAAADAGVR